MKLESLVITGQLYCGEYVLKSCTHRPSTQGSRKYPKSAIRRPTVSSMTGSKSSLHNANCDLSRQLDRKNQLKSVKPSSLSVIIKGMKVIPREAGRVTYSTKIRELKNLPFTEKQKAIIIGMILGDGCLCDNWSKTNSRLIVSHSIDQSEYIWWKYHELKSHILTPPRYYERNRSLTIRTISHPEITKFREVFYAQKRKIVPQNIAKLITNPLVLAVWFMDDGNNTQRNGKSCGYHINTQSFTHKENKLLAESLRKIYGTEATLERNHEKYRLAVWKKDSREKIRNLTQPHILKDMLYKIG